MDTRDLHARAAVTEKLYSDPHNPELHLQRGQIHEQLGFPDLAAADAYRALTLFESVVDPDGCEFRAGRKRARVTPTSTTCLDLRVAVEDPNDDQLQQHAYGENANPGEPKPERDDKEEEDGAADIILTSQEEYDASIGKTYSLLVRSLMLCGCLRDAYEFCSRGIGVVAARGVGAVDSNDNGGHDDIRRGNLAMQMEEIKRLSRVLRCRQRQSSDTGTKSREEGKGSHYSYDDSSEDVAEAQTDRFDPSILNVQGFARRVLYPWNEHEPDRKALETLQLLNERSSRVAPKCEVRTVALPSLHDQDVAMNMHNRGCAASVGPGTSLQLGLFAKEDIEPGEIVLRESSLLTATNRLHDDLCDACNSPLPELSSTHPPVACENCDDTIFCSSGCHDRAQGTYHAAVCGQEGLESIGKDIADPKDKADYLYLLLLGRAMAMAATQDVHPLDLPEVKYIWGDFQDLTAAGSSLSLPSLARADNIDPLLQSNSDTLPFSFQLNILRPTRFLEEMGIDPFASLPRYDTWVLNSLYAKFRGTASGRLSTWDGGPEVCAVHPLWCLANHSCDPNVRWEWGGEIVFVARTAAEKAVWKGEDVSEDSKAREGIRKGEEILNHYCDIKLGVKERREWAKGALGGVCLCERCIWEDCL